MTHLQLGAAYVIFKDVPHSMMPKLFTRRGLTRQCLNIKLDTMTHLQLRTAYVIFENVPLSMKSKLFTLKGLAT